MLNLKKNKRINVVYFLTGVRAYIYSLWRFQKRSVHEKSTNRIYELKVTSLCEDIRRLE